MKNITHRHTNSLKCLLRAALIFASISCLSLSVLGQDAERKYTLATKNIQHAKENLRIVGSEVSFTGMPAKIYVISAGKN